MGIAPLDHQMSMASVYDNLYLSARHIALSTCIVQKAEQAKRRLGTAVVSPIGVPSRKEAEGKRIELSDNPFAAARAAICSVVKSKRANGRYRKWGLLPWITRCQWHPCTITCTYRPAILHCQRASSKKRSRQKGVWELLSSPQLESPPGRRRRGKESNCPITHSQRPAPRFVQLLKASGQMDDTGNGDCSPGSPDVNGIRVR